MKDRATLFYEAAFMGIWAIIAFLISISPLSVAVYWKLAFRNIYAPIFYFGWVFLGVFFMMRIYKKDKYYVRAFTFGAVALNLLALTPQIINNENARFNMSPAYLIYIYTAIYFLALLLSLWALHYLFDKNISMFLPRMPLALISLMCLAYSYYQKNALGAVIFGISGASLIAIAFFWSRFKELIDAAQRVLMRIWQNDAAVAWLIFLTAFIARVVFSFVVIAKTGNRYILASDDGMTYDEVARAICAAPRDIIKILVKQPWPPVYMTYLSVVYKLFGKSFYINSVFQSIFGASVAVLIYAMGKRIFNKRTGAIAGILVVFSQPLIFVSSVLGTEAVYVPLVILAMYLFLKGRPAISGFAFGLASMTIGSVALFPIPAFFFILFSKGIRERLLGRLGIALIFLLSFMMTYTAIKSIYVFSDNSLRSEYETAGVSLWSTISAYGYDKDPDNREFIALGIDPVGNPAESIAISLRNWKKVLAIGCRIFPIRLRNFFLWNNFGFFDPIFMVNSGKIANTFASTLEFYALICFLAGLFVSFIKSARRWELAFIALYICYYAFTHAILIVAHTNRYSCPVKPFLILFLGYGIFLGHRYLFGHKKA